MKLPSIRTALIAAAIVALGAFVMLRIGDATAQSGCIQPIPDSGTVTGAWNADCLSQNTPTEPTNPPSGTRYARFYTFTLSEVADVTIDLNSNTDTYLFLMEGTGANGVVIHENDDVQSDNTNSRISESLTAGNYTVEATTFDLEATGDFTLTVSGLLAAVPTPTTQPGVPTPTTEPATPEPTSTIQPTPTIQPTSTQQPVSADVLNRLDALETLAATQQGLISTLESKITALDSRVAALEADASNPTPTPTPTEIPIATPTTTPATTTTPEPSVTPTTTATPATTTTPEPTATPTNTPAPSPTATNTPTPAATSTPEPTVTKLAHAKANTCCYLHRE